MTIRIPDALTWWEGPLEDDLTKAINEYMMMKTQCDYIDIEIRDIRSQRASLHQAALAARIKYEQIMSEEIEEQSE